MPLSPSERRLRAQLAAHASWANTSDPSARTEPARRARFEQFEDQVDPNRELPEADRRRRAESARRAWYTSLALKSAKARRQRAGGRRS